MFAASFDSKMGCLYSVFDVKKQGKPVWVVRARNWKLRGGENRLLGLLACVSIASVGKARRQGGSNITIVQFRHVAAQISAILVSSIDTLSGVSIPKSNTGIWVSVPAREGIGTPVSILAFEYQYQLPENRFWTPLKPDFLHLGPYVCHPLIGHESNRMSSRRPNETRSFRCVVNHHRMVVYRSRIFGFDSGIPRVTTSGRFCDWTGSARSYGALRTVGRQSPRIQQHMTKAILVTIDWRGARMVVVESDSRVAVSWVLKRENRPWRFWRWFRLIDEACLSLSNLFFHNVFREVNGMVNVLAKSDVDRRSWLQVV
ncbi:hypothetical protein GQ457_17G012270 [Hibiscus cannabinus]